MMTLKQRIEYAIPRGLIKEDLRQDFIDRVEEQIVIFLYLNDSRIEADEEFAMKVEAFKKEHYHA